MKHLKPVPREPTFDAYILYSPPSGGNRRRGGYGSSYDLLAVVQNGMVTMGQGMPEDAVVEGANAFDYPIGMNKNQLATYIEALRELHDILPEPPVAKKLPSKRKS